MDRQSVLTVMRAATAIVVIFAISVQMATSIGAGTFNPTRFFAFFTILSNVFGAAVFLALVLRRRKPRSDALDVLRGGSVVYLTVTFIVVIWLLSGVDLQVAIPWVDFILHKLFPALVVADWLVDPPAQRLTYRRGLVWLAYPVVWVALTLARGALDNWYPYPFLDPSNGGYGSVAFYFVAILLGFVAISGVTVTMGNAMRGRHLLVR